MARLAPCACLWRCRICLRRGSHFLPQSSQSSFRPSGQPLHTPYCRLGMTDAVTLHGSYCRINQIEQFEPKLYSRERQFSPVFLRSHLDNSSGNTRISVIELPSRQHRKQQECIFILEPLQSISTTAKKDEVIEGSIGRKSGHSLRINLSLKEWAPRKKPRHQLPPRVCKLSGKGAGQLRSYPALFLFRRIPLSLLYGLCLFTLGDYSSFSCLGLCSRRHQGNYHCRNRHDRSSPPTQRGNCGPIEIAGGGRLEARSQVLEFGHLQFHLWNSGHSATSTTRWEAACG